MTFSEWRLVSTPKKCTFYFFLVLGLETGNIITSSMLLIKVVKVSKDPFRSKERRHRLSAVSYKV